MARWKLYGFERYLEDLEALAAPPQIQHYMKEAIKAGAAIVADNTKTALENLEVDNSPATVERRRSINQLQKNGLIDSYGIAPFRYDRDFLNVKVGFDGYNKVITKRWPQGQPNVVIARSLESGTSFMRKNPVISRTESQSKDACFNAMQESLNESIEKLMK